MKQKRMKSLFFTVFLYTAFIACSDEGGKDENGTVNPKEQWSATLKGDGEVLGAYPDLFSNYWEYTYDMTDYPDVALRIKGQYPPPAISVSRFIMMKQALPLVVSMIMR